MRRLLTLAALLAAQPALAAAPAGDWQLVWSDEFTGSTLDRTKWDFDVDCWGGGNNERQCYTDTTRNTRVVAGKLPSGLKSWPGEQAVVEEMELT